MSFMERNSASWSLALAYHLGLDVINALEFLHGHGVNHNSIIPANILLVARSGVSGPSDPTVMTPVTFVTVESLQSNKWIFLLMLRNTANVCKVIN